MEPRRRAPGVSGRHPRSKQQEDQIIVKEVQTLKKRMPEANVSKRKMKEFLVRLVYVEMLGHDASFG